MNFREGQPIYQQIAERLIDEILAGKYISDERIPGVREYSLLLQVNVNTTVKAFDILARQGIIYNKRGLGSFVSADAVKIIRRLRSDDVLNGMLQELAKQMYLLGIPMEKVTDRLQQLINEEMATPTVG
jgi:transcriptional regulator, gntR family